MCETASEVVLVQHSADRYSGGRMQIEAGSGVTQTIECSNPNIQGFADPGLVKPEAVWSSGTRGANREHSQEEVHRVPVDRQRREDKNAAVGGGGGVGGIREAHQQCEVGGGFGERAGTSLTSVDRILRGSSY